MLTQTAVQPIKILVIDDNKDFAYMLSTFFNRLGYKSSAAYDEKSGVQRALELQPDLILCDIGLPARGCYEIARQIKSDYAMKHVMLAALTCYAHERVKQLVKELGFDFYISKPIQTSILDDLLQKIQMRKTNLIQQAYRSAV